MPIYTYSVVFGVAVLTFLAVCIRIHLAEPLQRYYLPAYEGASAFGSGLKTHKSTYRHRNDLRRRNRQSQHRKDRLLWDVSVSIS